MTKRDDYSQQINYKNGLNKHMSDKVKIKTLGCKVNHCESDAILSLLLKDGYSLAKKDEEADVCIINTCTVTERASTLSRQAIRKFARENQKAKIIVTGCYVNAEREVIENIEGVDVVFSNEEKNNIAEYLTCRQNNFFVSVSNRRTRAFLKIQDGCNSFCSYCIIPFTRNKLTSVSPFYIHKKIKELSQKGFKEVVLTGIHLGLYGKDSRGEFNLFSLLNEIDKKKSIKRVRLSSIEPKELTDEIIELFSTSEILCPHFHISLQSGDDKILKAMNRPYDTLFFRDLIFKIKEKIPFASIGLDIICGFPDENEKAFLNTYSFIKMLPISYLHIFPFSKRKNTKAFYMKNEVPFDVKKDRSKKLIELGESKKKRFYDEFKNSELELLIESKEGSFYKGKTKNYIVAKVKSSVDITNQIIKTRLGMDNAYIKRALHN